VLAALSTGDLMKVVELLYGMQCFSMAANFIEACFQEGLLAITEKNCILHLLIYSLHWNFSTMHIYLFIWHMY